MGLRNRIMYYFWLQDKNMIYGNKYTRMYGWYKCIFRHHGRMCTPTSFEDSLIFLTS